MWRGAPPARRSTFAARLIDLSVQIPYSVYIESIVMAVTLTSIRLDTALADEAAKLLKVKSRTEAIHVALLHRLHPTQEALLECPRIEPGQDAPQGIIGGDAIAEVEVAGEPLPTVAGEFVEWRRRSWRRRARRRRR